MSKNTPAVATSIVDAAEAKAKQLALVNVMKSAGSTIGKYMAKKEKMKGELVASVTDILQDAMTNHGLTVDMLKAPTKETPRPCYTGLVDAMSKTCGGALDVRVRDNYMSKIRAYVKDRGANPLDLFGNLATKAKQQAASLTTVQQPATPTTQPEPTKENVQPETNDVDSGKVISFTAKDKQPVAEVDTKGLPALVAYLDKWLEANPVMPAKYIDLAKAFKDEIAKAIPKAK